MDWFERITGFRETDYFGTRSKLAVEGNRLVSTVNGKSYAIGELELPSLGALRDRAKSFGGRPGRLNVSVVEGDGNVPRTEDGSTGGRLRVWRLAGLVKATAGC